MKKIIVVALAFLSLCLVSCKDKTITTQYTIGCLGFQYGSAQGSDWEDLESYFSSHVDYNKLISFESTSLTENDAKAKQHFDEQLKKLDTVHVCSLLHGADYFNYGIATRDANGNFRSIKTVQFTGNGMSVLDMK